MVKTIMKHFFEITERMLTIVVRTHHHECIKRTQLSLWFLRVGSHSSEKLMKGFVYYL